MAKNIARNIMDNTVAEKTARRPSAGHTDAISLYAADGHRKYLNLSERQRAIAAMEGLDPDKALFALTLAWTGARVSEVLALTPASFQLDRGVVAIVTLKRRRFTVREVPVPGSLLELINTSFGLSAAQRDPELSRRRLWPWHRVTAWRLIKQIMRQCGLAGCAASPRGFRHGFGVGALQAGAPLNLVQRWLGHATIGTTAIYADASGPEEQAFAGRFWNFN
jgi:integrase